MTAPLTQMIEATLAFIWSFLILGERPNGQQIVGITIVLGGLLAVRLMNRRAYPAIARSVPTSAARK